MTKPKDVRVGVPISAVGYGVNAETLSAIMRANPDVLAADAGSTDSGPFYLGAGKSNKARRAVKRDLQLIVSAARRARIPVVIGNVGTSGARPHVEWTLEILHEVAQELNERIRVAVIWADISPEFALERLMAEKIHSLPGVPDLTSEKIRACTRIVGQMGVEPYLRALDSGVDVILAGRSCDTAIIASYPIWRGHDHGIALHMAKIVECGAMCAWPATGRDGIMATVRANEFVIESPNPKRMVTPFSVAAHMIYEVEHPYLQEEPGGTQDFSEVQLESLGESAVTVRGSKYIRRLRPTVKLEGAAQTGFRSFLIGGNRDPFLIQQIDAYREGVMQEARSLLGEAAERCRVDWKIYGRDAVMGSMEPTPSLDGAHEVGLLVQVLAPTQELAHDVCQFIEARMIGYAYPNAITRTAHVAFPISPLVHDAGPAYRFELFHVAELESWSDFESLFPVEFAEMNGSVALSARSK